MDNLYEEEYNMEHEEEEEDDGKAERTRKLEKRIGKISRKVTKMHRRI